MHDALAVVPAFASDHYYTTKASSSVAAALICGTPLLASAELLAAYSYLHANATFLQVKRLPPFMTVMACDMSHPVTAIAMRGELSKHLRGLVMASVT